MPFFNLATTDDHDELEQSLNKTFKQTVKNKDLVGDILSRVEMIDSRLKDNNDRIMKDHDGYRDDISRLDTCTKLIKGVYVCDKPMYEKVIAPRDLKVKDVASPSDNICLKVETLDDLIESENIKHAKRHLGTRDVPDNYLCLEKTSLEQYVDAFIPERILRYADTVKDEKIIKVQQPRCHSACYNHTCEQIKNKRMDLHKALELRNQRLSDCDERERKETTISVPSSSFSPTVSVPSSANPNHISKTLSFSPVACRRDAQVSYQNTGRKLRHFPRTVEISCGACSAKAKCKPFA